MAVTGASALEFHEAARQHDSARVCKGLRRSFGLWFDLSGPLDRLPASSDACGKIILDLDQVSVRRTCFNVDLSFSQ